MAKTSQPNIYKDDKRGTYYYAFNIRHPLTGDKIQKKARGFKNIKEAKFEMERVRQEILESTSTAPKKVKFMPFVEDWFESRKTKVQPETYERDYMLYNNYVKEKFKNAELQKINSLAIQRYFNELREENLSPATMKLILSIVRQVFQKAKDFNIIKENPVNSIDIPKEKNKRLKVWNKDQIDLFFREAKSMRVGQRYYIGYVIALYTGLRRGEILGLKWSDIDFDNNLIYIRRTLSSQHKVFKERTKTESGTRIVSMPKVLAEILVAHREKLEIEKVTYKDKYEDHDLVVCTLYGKPIDGKNFNRTFKDVATKLELPLITIHDLRHTHATALMGANIHPKLISERLGHANIGITLDIYSHILPSMQKEVANKLDDMFDKSK